ncbi:hypothetical protein ACRAWG_30335 [Methylobacterium sp. P31]
MSAILNSVSGFAAVRISPSGSQMRRARGQMFEPDSRLEAAAAARISVETGEKSIIDQHFDLNTR